MVQLDRLERAVLPAQIGHHWWSYFAEGVLLVLLGIVSILAPIIASVAFAFVLGIIFLVAGAAGLIGAISHPKQPGLAWSLISAAITIVAGLLLAGGPVRGALSLTFVLAVYLFAEGIASFAYAWSHRDHLPHGWGWMVLNGVIDIIMGAVVLWVLPFVVAAIWILGLFIGIDFILGGSSLIRMGTAARHQLAVAVPR